MILHSGILEIIHRSWRVSLPIVVVTVASNLQRVGWSAISRDKIFPHCYIQLQP